MADERYSTGHAPYSVLRTTYSRILTPYTLSLYRTRTPGTTPVPALSATRDGCISTASPVAEWSPGLRGV